MSKDLTPCPNCGSLAKYHLYSVSTLIFRPTQYDKDGNEVFSEYSDTSKVFQCMECGKEFSNEK